MDQAGRKERGEHQPARVEHHALYLGNATANCHLPTIIQFNLTKSPILLLSAPLERSSPSPSVVTIYDLCNRLNEAESRFHFCRPSYLERGLDGYTQSNWPPMDAPPRSPAFPLCDNDTQQTNSNDSTTVRSGIENYTHDHSLRSLARAPSFKHQN